MNMKKMFLLNLPYLLFVYPFDKLAQAFRLAPGADLSGKLLSIGDGFTATLSSPWLSFQPTDLLIGIRKKELTKKMATDLLKKGRTNVKEMWSEKKQSTYDAAVILDDTGGKYINFKLEFPKRKEQTDGRK